jgi:hypothetical protein
VDPIASSHLRVGGGPLLVHEHGDVLPDLALIVEDPSDEPGMRALEGLEELGDRGAVDLDLATPGQVAKRRTKGDDGHAIESLAGLDDRGDLHLHQDGRIDELEAAHRRVGRTDVPEDLAVGPRRLLPT